MALINCEECGGTVSINADSCPHCGSKKFWVGPKPTSIPGPPIIFKHDENTPLKTKLYDYGCTVVLIVIGVCIFLGILFSL